MVLIKVEAGTILFHATGVVCLVPTIGRKNGQSTLHYIDTSTSCPGLITYVTVTKQSCGFYLDGELISLTVKTWEEISLWRVLQDLFGKILGLHGGSFDLYSK